MGVMLGLTHGLREAWYAMPTEVHSTWTNVVQVRSFLSGTSVCGGSSSTVMSVRRIQCMQRVAFVALTLLPGTRVALVYSCLSPKSFRSLRHARHVASEKPRPQGLTSCGACCSVPK